MSCGCEDDKPKQKGEHSFVTAGKSVIKHFTDPTYDAFTNEETQQHRLSICQDCELLTTFAGLRQCSACGCFLDAKVKLKSMRCEHPDSPKWIEE